MAGWNSVSGYLVHRPGGTLGRLKSKRRLWYVYDEGSCKLLYYKNETDSTTKRPLGAINIRGAAISLGQVESNEFIIYSDNKVYVLAADNHESLMIWTMGLQRNRDVALSRLSSVVSGNDVPACSKNHQSKRRKESLPSDQEMQAMIRRAQNAEGKAKIFRTRSLQLPSKPSVQKSRSLLSTAGNLWVDKPEKDSFLRLTPLVQSSDHSEEDEQVNEISCDEIAGVAGTSNEGNSNKEQLEKEVRSVIDLDRNNNDSRRGSLERYTKNSDEFRNDSDGNNSAKDSDSSAQTSGSETLDKYQKNCVSNSAQFIFSGDRVKVLKKINSDSYKTGELKRDFDRTGSVSGTSVSSDSAMGHSECDHSVRLEELEADLMTTKCELAKALNREAGCKSTISEKDQLIRDLHDRIRELEHKEDELWHSSNQKSTSAQRFQEKCRILQNLNRFLNEEVMKLSHLLNEERNHSERQHLTLLELQEEVEQFERDYVFLLQSSIRFTFRDGFEMMEVYQYGVDRHKARVLSLLEKARKVNPSLPAYDGVSKFMTHVDSLGFKHCISDKGLILHYICRQLHQFYSTHLITYKQHENHWKNYLRRHGNNLQSTKELKSLVRGGIPSHLRHLVWSALCRQKVKDVIIEKGCHYYNNLCSLAPESEVVSENRRQIGLDLLRTIPNNVRFSDPNADGVRKMQEVLQAFCLHNPSLGYCQGMNFLVGMCLLFLEPEDAFWCLVAVTEKYFTPNYFDQNLIGAQADQEVLKDLLKEKLPKLHNHLESNDIEISTITLNWFLAVFFDAVPFEVLLRIWDCFLLEGPKVLFRFTLAVLKMQEDAILARSDTVSIMRQIKVAAKLCFDVDVLVKTAFEELEPFPRRQDITARQACYQRTLLEKSKKRELERKAIKERENAFAEFDEEPTQFIMECAAVYDKDKIWLCHGHQNRSQLSKVTCDECIMYRLNIEFDTRVMCMYALDDDTMLLGSLSHFVYAYSTKSRKLIWEIRLNDSVLSLCFHDEDGMKKVYAGLADGTLAVIESFQGISPQPESFYIMIGPSPVTCLQRVTTRLWCASGNRVIILNVRTLDVVDHFHISTSVLDYISMLVLGEHGVWVSIRGSPLIQLWDLNSLTCRLLYDVRENRYPKAPRKEEENGVKSSRVTSLLPFDGSLLVGTGEGALIIFDVVTRLSCNSSAANSPFPRLQSPNIATGDQIQEKIQELFMEQQKVEEETELRFSDKKQDRYRKDSGCYTSTTPTSVVSLSRRPSLFPACDNDQPLLSNNISSPCKTSSSSVQQSDSSGQLSNDTVVSVYRSESTNTKPGKQRTGEDNNIRSDETADNVVVSNADGNSLLSNSQSIARENHEPHTEDDESTWSAWEKGSKYPFVDTVDQTQSDCPYRSSRAAEEVGQARTSEEISEYEEKENVVAEKINVSKNSPSNLENHSSFNGHFLTSPTVNAPNDLEIKPDKSKETYSNWHEARMTYSCEQHSDLTGNQSTGVISVSPKTGRSCVNIKPNWRKANKRTSLGRKSPGLKGRSMDKSVTLSSVDKNVTSSDGNQLAPSADVPPGFSDIDDTFGSSESVSRCSHLDKSFAFPSVKPPSQKKILSTSSKFLKRSHSLGDLYCLRSTNVLKRTVLTTTSTEGLHKYKSADSLSVSGMSDGFDFDDVFVTYTEDDSHKPSRITSKTPEIKELTAPTRFEIRRDSHKRKLTVNNYFTNRVSLESSEISRLLPFGLKSSTFLKPNLPDVRDQLPSWYKDGLITESDSSLLPVVRIDSEASLPKNESCSSFYMYMAQTSTTSNRASGEEFSTPVTENGELFRQNLLRPEDFSSSSTQKCSDTASNVSFGSSEFPYAYELILQERIKISDKPIRCLLLTQCEEGPTIISCAGCYGDDEAVLKWTKEGTEKLWTNDPIIEVCPYTNTIKPSPYARSRMPRRSSLNTANVASFSGACELESSPARAVWPSVMSSASNATSVMGSGLAKVHNMFSRTQEKS